MTKLTLSTAKMALKKIIEMTEVTTVDLSALIASIKAVATDAMSEVRGPSAMDLKIKEIADFMMGQFGLMFKSNDEIAEALNTAGIATTNGKEWARGNISKMMKDVQPVIVDMVNSTKSSDESVTDEAQAPIVLDEPELVQTSDMPVETVVEVELEVAPVPEPEPEPILSPRSEPEVDELAILSELEELEVG